MPLNTIAIIANTINGRGSILVQQSKSLSILFVFSFFFSSWRIDEMTHTKKQMQPFSQPFESFVNIPEINIVQSLRQESSDLALEIFKCIKTVFMFQEEESEKRAYNALVDKSLIFGRRYVTM
jgi:hypothetical protein